MLRVAAQLKRAEGRRPRGGEEGVDAPDEPSPLLTHTAESSALAGVKGRSQMAPISEMGIAAADSPASSHCGTISLKL